MLIDFNHIQTPFQLQNFSEKFNHPWQQEILQFSYKVLQNEAIIKVKTSGSTGHPKDLLFAKSQLMASAKLTGEYFNFSSNKTLLLCLSPKHIAGKMMIVRAICWKMKLLCKKQTANPLIDLTLNIYFTSLVSYQLEHILAKNPDKFQLIGKVLLGGAPIHHRLFKKIKNLSTKFYESFGMTETLSHIAIKKLNGVNTEKYFTTLPGVKLKVDKNECLIIETPYLNEPIFSNDIVQLKCNKKFKWIGRRDNLINSGGIKLIPELLEKKIKHLLNASYFFASLFDNLLGEKLILVVEDKNNKIDLDALSLKLETHLTKYEMPKQIIKLKCFCRTKNGKIKRIKTQNKFTP